jgi:hypothetical protein
MSQMVGRRKRSILRTSCFSSSGVHLAISEDAEFCSISLTARSLSQLIVAIGEDMVKPVLPFAVSVFGRTVENIV